MCEAWFHMKQSRTWRPWKLWSFGRVESRTSWRETKKIQIKLTTTCKKIEKQQDSNNNAKGTKTTW